MIYRPKSILLFVAGSCLFYTAFAAQLVYTPPVVPPGVDRTTFPVDRQEWLERVQDNFNKTQGKHFDLVFDGDSIVAGWIWQGRGLDLWNAHYAKLNAADFGLAGDQVQNVLWRLGHGQLDGINPKMVVLMIGSNNALYDPPEHIGEGVKVLLAEYLKDAPNARFLLLGIIPRGVKAIDPMRAKIAQANKLIASLADGKRVTYMDIGPLFLQEDGSLNPAMFVSDLVHPNAKGYQAWVDAMQPEIDQVFAPAPK
jgi:lysophospholipase L1-like esterase